MSECVHHWLLGQPGHGFTEGRCKLCGEEHSWKTPIYGGYANTPAILTDPLLPRILEGQFSMRRDY